MRKHPAVILIAAAAALSACAQQQEEQAPKPVQDSAFGDLTGTMDKARSVEATTMQRKNDLDAALQANEGADAAQ